MHALCSLMRHTPRHRFDNNRAAGRVYDADGVGRVACERGVPFLLDACQSAGQMPLDVAALRCDWLTGTARKYLRGPRGVGFLYASTCVSEPKGSNIPPAGCKAQQQRHVCVIATAAHIATRGLLPSPGDLSGQTDFGSFLYISTCAVHIHVRCTYLRALPRPERHRLLAYLPKAAQ